MERFRRSQLEQAGISTAKRATERTRDSLKAELREGALALTFDTRDMTTWMEERKELTRLTPRKMMDYMEQDGHTFTRP